MLGVEERGAQNNSNMEIVRERISKEEECFFPQCLELSIMQSFCNVIQGVRRSTCIPVTPGARKNYCESETLGRSFSSVYTVWGDWPKRICVGGYPQHGVAPVSPNRPFSPKPLSSPQSWFDRIWNALNTSKNTIIFVVI